MVSSVSWLMLRKGTTRSFFTSLPSRICWATQKASVETPGAIETEANAARYRDPAFRAAVVAKIPAGRQGQTEDLAGIFAFLCSDAASYITGADIPVDGGWSIGDAPGRLPQAAT